MNDDKRSHEASSLRSFFDNQLQHLQKLVISLSDHIHNKQQHTREDRQFVESFVDASNSKMRAVQGYAHKLREPIRVLYSHVLQIADKIPPPINLNQDAFITDSLVNALFVNRKDIDTLFNTDPEASAYLRAHNKHQVPVMFALLTADKSEKRTLGMGMMGEMLIREVAQQAVNFSSHKIHTPCAYCTELSTALKQYLFNRVVALIKQEMMSRISSQTLKPNDDSYEARVKGLANPDAYLDTLIEHLENPENLLSINKIHFKLSKLGIKVNGDDRQCANEFDLHELTWSNKTQSIILQIAYFR